MILQTDAYLEYLREHKPHTSQRTISNYRQTLSAIGINEFDTDNMSETWKILLDDKMPKHGWAHVQRFIAIMSAWAKKNHTVLTKDINYSKLRDAISAKMDDVKRVAYTDDQLMDIFSAVKRDSTIYNGLYNLCLLLLYSGLRVSAANGIKWENVRKVEGYPVYTFYVMSKGVGYNAIVSEKVMDYIRRTTLGGDYVIYYDKDNSTPFDKLYRKKLLAAIQARGLYSVREDTSIFHSFRKTFSEKLLTNHELEPEGFTYQLLMGHIPRTTTATKYYVHTDGTKEKLDVIKRCADAYSKSELVNMTIGLI